MKTKLIPVMAIALMGFFATTSFAQEEAVTEPQATKTEVVADEGTSEEAVTKTEKEDPRAGGGRRVHRPEARRDRKR